MKRRGLAPLLVIFVVAGCTRVIDTPRPQSEPPPAPITAGQVSDLLSEKAEEEEELQPVRHRRTRGVRGPRSRSRSTVHLRHDAGRSRRRWVFRRRLLPHGDGWCLQFGFRPQGCHRRCQAHHRVLPAGDADHDRHGRPGASTSASCPPPIPDRPTSCSGRSIPAGGRATTRSSPRTTPPSRSRRAGRPTATTCLSQAHDALKRIEDLANTRA